MPLGTNNLEFLGYYSNLGMSKSIQTNFRFFLTIWDDDFSNHMFSPKNPIGARWYSDLDYLETDVMPDISHFHVLSVSIPQYPFSKEVIKYGPISKTFPVMDNFNGLDIDVEFEEDEFGTVAYFINWLQRKIVRKDGTYRSQLDNRIDNMVILTEDEQGIPINIFWYKNVYFQNATQPTFRYDGNDSIKYIVTFGCDLVKFLPAKALLKEKLKEEIVGKIMGV